MLRHIRPTVFTLVVLLLLTLPGATPDTLGFKVYREAYKEYFDILGWMIEKLVSEVSETPLVGRQTNQVAVAVNGTELVKRYLELNKQIAAVTPRASDGARPNDMEAYRKLTEERDRLEPQAQTVLRRQLEEVLRDEGLTSSIAGLNGVLPPPLFSFTPLPKILIISPRDKIRVETSIPLSPDLSWTAAEAIEGRVSKIDVSALVVSIGGLGAYPPMIPRTSSLEFLAKTLPHEWAHNYLTFRPLGFRYTFQVENDYDVRTMNESAASIIGEEIGDRILVKYYGYPSKQHPREPQRASETPPAESDFARRMRAIRLKVDDCLAKGQVSQAEQHMAEEQKKLQADGYDVRKLNQAYFAFYGSYATSPGYTNPVGEAVTELRFRSTTLKAFVDRIGEMRSSEELKGAVRK